MNLFKTSFWSAISSIIKILAGLITTKIMAIYVGPTGIALLGNFTNITGILTTFANGAIGSGITKYISEFDSEEEKKKVISHAVKICLTFSFVIGISVIFVHNPLAKLAFGETKYSSVFVIYGLTVVFFGLNTTISSILNGYRHIKYLIFSGIMGSVLSAILAYIITIRFGLFGAFINTVIAQLCIFLINIKFIGKLKLFNFLMLLKPIDRSLLLRLLKFAVMSLVSVLVVPTSTIILRSYILNNFTPNEAGYVQGVWTISSAYLMVVTSTLSVYYLPTLSSIKDNANLLKEIIKGYKFLLPIAIIGGTGVFLCRDLIIHILYTPEFLPMKRFFTFQIIGDTLKIASWILGYLMIAKAMTKLFLITEIVFALLNVIFSFMFMNAYGSIGVTYGYALNYSIFLIYLIIIFRKLLFKRHNLAE